MSSTASPPSDADLDARRAQARRELRACAQRLGRSPSMRAFAADPHTSMHPQTIVKLYGRGGWNAAKRDAGLTVRRGASDAELLDALAAKTRQLGRPPVTREINADPDMPSVSLYLQRFGTLREAFRQAGISTPAAASTEQMIRAGIDLALQLGRLPTFPDWQAAHQRNPGLPSPWQVYRRFGGGEGAWRLFGYYLTEAAHESGVQLPGS